MANEYDISQAFEDVEMELIKKLKRQMERYIPNGTETPDWNKWQIECLKALEQFKKENTKYFNKECTKINKEIEDMLNAQYNNGFNKEETNTLNAIKNGANLTKTAGKVAFFGVDNNKMNALLNETLQGYIEKEHTILRNIDDVYRKTIFSAQVYFNSGAGTLWDAVDMATSKFMENGICSIQYKNGANVNIASYSEMALRTSNIRAKNYGEGAVRDEWGTHLVQVTSYGSCSPTCLPWQGKIYVDDVYSNPSNEEKNGKYRLLSEAMEGGLYHPNCRHSHTTYYEGISRKASIDKSSKEISENYKKEQEQRYNERQIRKWKKQEELALGDKKKNAAHNKVLEWQKKQRELIQENPQLRRDYVREKVRVKGDNTINNNGNTIKNIVKEPPKPTYTPATNFKESIELLKSEHIGFKNVQERALKNRNEEAIVASTNQLAKLESKFGIIGKSGDCDLISKPDGNAYAYVTCYINQPQNQILSLCPLEYNETTQEIVKESIRESITGFKMPYADVNDALVYTVTHEYGHMIENNLTLNELQDEIDWYKIMMISQDPKNPGKGWISTGADEVTRGTILKEYKKFQSKSEELYAKYRKEIIEIAKENNKEFELVVMNKQGVGNISRYGASKPQEFFAECFANSQLSKPNELGEAMNIWLKRKGVTK